MRTPLKIALTILLSLLLTGVFAALAYTGLFRVLETDFFSRRVETDQRLRLEEIAGIVDAWNEENLSRFDSLSRDRYFQTVYSVTQREEEIAGRAESVESLKDRLIGFDGFRIVDRQGRIQYSSFAGDVAAEQTGERRLYANWDKVTGSFDLPEPDGGQPRILYAGETQRILYLIPSIDQAFVERGWMIAYMSPAGLGSDLAGGGLIDPAGRVHVVDGRGFILDLREDQADAVREDIDRLWPRGGQPVQFALLAEGRSDSYWLTSRVSEGGTWVGKLLPGGMLRFSAVVQILIIATVFITTALVSFLVLNFRPDKTEISRGRIKRLQVNLLKEWLEHHEGKKLGLADLEARRPEVRRELRAGLGKLRTGQADKIDKIIDEGWDRIIEILADKELIRGKEGADAESSSTAAQPPIDMKQLEAMITRAVAEAVPKGALATAVQADSQPMAPAPGRPIQVDVVEEGDEPEELAELSEVEEIEELSEVEEAEELGEPVEVEEIEELSEVEEAGELGEPVEVEEIEELSEAEEAEELGEPVEVEEVEEIEEPSEAEEAGELGEPVEVEEIEELSEADEAGETGEPVEVEEVEELEELTEAGEFEETLESEGISGGVSTDNLEELESLDELEPLPPEEEEEDVLEVLPVVLSDDTRELIEIDKVDRDRLYMFDEEFETDKREPDGTLESAELEELDESVEEIEELEESVEEIEELEEFEEIAEKSAVRAVTEISFISVDDIRKSLRSGEPGAIEEVPREERSGSMESLFKTRTTGILPGFETSSEGFLFDEDMPELSWSEDGLDYDRYLKGFKKGATGIYKSLMSLSKEYGALCGVLLSGSRKGLETDYAVGLDDESATNLSTNRNEELWQKWFSDRKIVFVPSLSASLYAEKTKHNDFRYIKAALFLPAIYHGTQSYIFLGFKEAPKDPMSLLTSMETVV